MSEPESADLDIQEQLVKTALALHFRGRCTARTTVTRLAPALTQAITRCASMHGSLTLHFEALSHLDSATIGALVRALELAKRAGVPVTISYDARVRWQRLNFTVLQGHARAGGATFRTVA